EAGGAKVVNVSLDVTRRWSRTARNPGLHMVPWTSLPVDERVARALRRDEAFSVPLVVCPACWERLSGMSRASWLVLAAVALSVGLLLAFSDIALSAAVLAAALVLVWAMGYLTARRQQRAVKGLL